MNRDRGLWWAYEVQGLPDPVRMLAVIEISLSLSLSLTLALAVSAVFCHMAGFHLH